jgi:beta-aspartyl-peptidase (threonine type)
MNARYFVTPTIIASENGRAGMVAAMALLRQGGAALDAVELACRVIEDDPEDHGVGYGGMPNLRGEVELDASIMDGRTLRAGAVAAVRGYGNPITLARRVMEELPHLLLVGRGAEYFAGEMGQMMADQRTDEALRRWRERFAEYGLEASATKNLRQTARRLSRPVAPQEKQSAAAKNDVLGTVDFLALDSRSDLASAVSTSGVAWKYPGRVGDSPIIGAGNYCDNRYGAAACTGLGELAMRVSTARSAILYMKMGMSLHEAGLEALRDLAALEDEPFSRMNFVVLSPRGEHGGFSMAPGKNYLFMAGDMDEPAAAARVSLAQQ